MKHIVKHDLGQEMARKVAERAFQTYGEKFAKYNPTARWTTADTCQIGFTAKGVKLEGTVVVRAGEIELELEVPFLLRPFQGKAIELIEGEIRAWIAKARAGEL